MPAPIVFKSSKPFSIGTEIELQLIDPLTGKPKNCARDLLAKITPSAYASHIKPEITQSMIELNSAVHTLCDNLYDELLDIKNFLLIQSKSLHVAVAGGGTHPFQQWKNCHVFPTARFRNLLHEYGYLAKRFTTFGQHVHIGCANGDDAIYLTQALYRYLPHFITLSASSPFYQGVKTGFYSTRINVVTAFPTSGFMPYITSWQEFDQYLQKLFGLNVIKSIKDIYWDIRPKAEFGTVEIRIFDTPLSLEKMIMLVAYTQALAAKLLTEKRSDIIAYDAMLYNYNRYQASRYGFNGYLIDPRFAMEKINIAEDILATLDSIKPYATQFNSQYWLKQIEQAVQQKCNDAKLLQAFFADKTSFAKLMQWQAQLFYGGEV